MLDCSKQHNSYGGMSTMRKRLKQLAAVRKCVRLAFGDCSKQHNCALVHWLGGARLTFTADSKCPRNGHPARLQK